jgi:ketosteroid isomerase-like protein
MLLAALAIVLTLAPAPARDEVPEPLRVAIADTLRSLELQWIGVYASHDLAPLEHLIADDFVGTLADGSMRGKRAHIQSYRDDFAALASVTSGEVEIHVFQADVAVVTGLYTATLRDPQAATPGRFRWTDTWLKRDGRWQCIATHENQLPGK